MSRVQKKENRNLHNLGHKSARLLLPSQLPTIGQRQPRRRSRPHFQELMSDPQSVEELQPGTVLPTHGRTMKEQKSFFLQKAAAFKEAQKAAAAKEAKAARAASASGAATSAAATDASPSPTSKSDGSSASCYTVVAPPPSAPSAVISPEPASTAAATTTVDVSDSASGTAPAATSLNDNGLSGGLQALSLAGGDVPALAALAAGESASTELTVALKNFGFKGLQTRKRLEQDLRAYAQAH